MTDLVISLPLVLPTLNRWERMHWRERSIFKKRLALEIAVALTGRRPVEPMPNVEIKIFRHMAGVQPDQDNGIAKAVLDVLQPPTKTHPYGLGIIAGDDPARCSSKVQTIRERYRSDQRTVITIRARDLAVSEAAE